MSRTDKTLTKSEKRLLIAVGLFVVIVLSFAYWKLESDVDPVLCIPPARPGSFGYDLCLKACDKVQYKAIHHANGISSPEENLSNYLMLLKYDRSSLSTWPSFTKDEIGAVVRRNAPHYTALHRAFLFPIVAPSLRPSMNDAAEFQVFYMSLALHIAGYDCTLQRDWPKAIEYYLDSMQLGSDISHGWPKRYLPTIIFCQSRTRSECWATIDHLNSSQAGAAARRLEKINIGLQPLADMLQEEKWYQQQRLMEVFHNPGWRTHDNNWLSDLPLF